MAEAPTWTPVRLLDNLFISPRPPSPDTFAAFALENKIAYVLNTTTRAESYDTGHFCIPSAGLLPEEYSKIIDKLNMLCEMIKSAKSQPVFIYCDTGRDVSALLAFYYMLDSRLGPCAVGTKDLLFIGSPGLLRAMENAGDPVQMNPSKRLLQNFTHRNLLKSKFPPIKN